ncbi:N-Dimethylarginine dimethylaminohydrolase [Sporobacter termitidis DSM 10068]|uniref:N-Dimethylarginine dimethylaminohydrolase n=1 Tax=Sporobacter termitidis DSM 10068 TaxID=1123282 RepID=A0A1M5WLT7_9FIRM|nr:arginine deiminase family protein [Sporobacter termitidis]SHH88511.1 N-Dimethylarginine dimethylaminohydrolase [Sporobacter termitidis DSM 10068]
MQSNITSLKIYGLSEYDVIKEVILCSPEYMRIDEIINLTQRKYAKENICSELAVKQHSHLIQILQENDIKVHLLSLQEDLPEQVFTRDIGFVIGRRFFVSNLKERIRLGETKILKEWLNDRHFDFVELQAGCIEGGDVIVDKDLIWLGLSDRTSESVINELADRCPGYTIQPVAFDPDFLHFDCTFNVISEFDALIYRNAFKREELLRLSNYYNLIEISKEEQFTLGTNVLSIGQGKIISSPQNKQINKKLAQLGYHVINVDISEILKSGGAFRCITLPIVKDYSIVKSNKLLKSPG